jgi:cysteine desulfurase/selenocysteine lyase
MHLTGVYLDNASTYAPKPDVVWQAARAYIDDVAASPGRGGYRAARGADEIVEGARASLARLLGVPKPGAIAFAANATHALNTAIQGTVGEGDHVVTTTTEHNSVLRPLETLARAGRITCTRVPVSASGLFDLDRFAAAVRPGTRLVAVNHASNVTGAVAPVVDMCAIAHEAGALFLLDASQTAGALDIDVEELGCDLLAFTGHKSLRGPSGTGGLYVRDPDQVRPLLQGGTGLNSHALVQPALMPTRLEAGTPNYLGIAGLGAAVDLLLDDEDIARTRRALTDLTEYCLLRLRALDAVRVYEVDPGIQRVPVISINMDGLYASELSSVLDSRHGIMTRAGLHCAPLIHEALGTAPHGTVRVSLGSANTRSDVDALIGALDEIRHDSALVPCA